MQITKDDVGRRIWSFTDGWGEIEGIDEGDRGVHVFFFDKESSYYFTLAGKFYEDDINPTLFWDEIKLTEPEKPKPKIKKKIERWTNIYEDGDSGVYYITEKGANNSAGEGRVACVKLVGEYEVEG